MRLAARRRALIGRERRVALDELHAVERHIELFGDKLRLHGIHALAELGLTGVGGHVAVCCDGDPRIKLRAPLAIETLRNGRLEGIGEIHHAERDDERARALEKITAGGAGVGCHLSLGGRPAHRALPSAYRLMARSMRVCAKQRHSTPDIAC